MKWKVGLSKIDGNGVFAAQDCGLDDDLGIGIKMVRDENSIRIFQRNTFGLLINHSKIPNSRVEKIGDDWHFVAKMFIKKDDEITVDYDEYEKKVDAESLATKKLVSVV